MNFKVYKFNQLKLEIDFLEDYQVPDSLVEKLKLFETEVVKEFFSEQKGKKGITTLGNKIRYNDVLNKNVFSNSLEYEFKKATGNKSQFLKDFILDLDDKLIERFYLIYNKEFRQKSSIVDGTSPSLDYIEKDLKLLFSTFINYKLTNSIFFIEIEEFEDYYFSKNEKFTKIYKYE